MFALVASGWGGASEQAAYGVVGNDVGGPDGDEARDDGKASSFTAPVDRVRSPSMASRGRGLYAESVWKGEVEVDAGAMEIETGRRRRWRAMSRATRSGSVET